MVRVAGGCVAVVLGAMTAAAEAFLTPYPWAVPVAAAALGNLMLYWFAQHTVAKVWAWLLPAVPWFLLMIIAVGASSEGDLIANSWAGLATFGAGALGFVAPAAWPRRPPQAKRLVDSHGPGQGPGQGPGHGPGNGPGNGHGNGPGQEVESMRP